MSTNSLKMWLGSVVLLVGLISVALQCYAQESAAERVLRKVAALYADEDPAFESHLKDAQILAGLEAQATNSIAYLSVQLSAEERSRRIGAAATLAAFLGHLRQTGKAFPLMGKHFEVFETLKDDLLEAFQQNDPELQGLAYTAWTQIFDAKALSAAVKRSPPRVGYKTDFFFVHSGGILLNPYTIQKDDEGRFMLEESGETEARFFIEALYRNRYAWQDKEFRPYSAMDYEMRLGAAGADNDPSGAVVSGGGDAYMEFSIGKLLPCVQFDQLLCLNNLERAAQEGVKWVTNIEALAGFVTDKGAQDLHFYWGIGPVVTVGIPYVIKEASVSARRIEILGGVYFGQTDKPRFVDGESREVESRNDLPEFGLEWSAIWRGDVRLPIGQYGFLTIGGRFTSNLEGEGINPWNMAIGYTIPVEVLTDSVAALFKQ